MELVLRQIGKKKAGKLTVSDDVFAQAFNEHLVHQVLVSYMAAGRAGTKQQKNRSDVRGGGRKPWQQKGLGRARAGSIRSPIWRGGGVTFAARPRDYTKKVNRKMYRGAMRSIFSELARQERLSCVDQFVVEEPRTKNAKALLAEMGLTDVLIIADDVTNNTLLATRNIPHVSIIDTVEINPYSLIGFENVLITKAAVEKIEKWLA